MIHFYFFNCFFFITFLSCVRWCNPRLQPKRETRGVSRSKCGDLITATIPVSWAISIIISESADAIDYYDGFNTTELIVGIRAYQWGWEYYYPKDIDLKYSVKPNYNQFLGNSLKYEKKSDLSLNHNKMFNMLKKNNFNNNSNISVDLISPSFSKNNFFKTNNLNKTTYSLDSSFKNITKYSKLDFSENFQRKNNSKNLNNFSLSLKNKYDKNNFKVIREYNLINLKSFLKANESILDLSVFKKINKKIQKLDQSVDFLNKDYQNNNLNNQMFNFFIKKKILLNTKFFFKNSDKNIYNIYMLGANKFVGVDQTNSIPLANQFFKKTINFDLVTKVNKIEKSDVLLDSNLFRKKLKNHLFNESNSPFTIQENAYRSKINSSYVTPLAKLNSPFLDSSIENTFLKKSNKTILFVDTQLSTHVKNLWVKHFSKNNSSTFFLRMKEFKNSTFKNPLSSFFLYQDYDFLNKEYNKLFDFISYRQNINLLEVDNNKYKEKLYTPSFIEIVEFNTQKSKKKIDSLLSTKHSTNPIQFIIQNNRNKINLNFLNIDNNHIMFSFKLQNLVLNSYSTIKNTHAYFTKNTKNIFLSNEFFLQNYSFFYYINSYKLFKGSSFLGLNNFIKKTNNATSNEFFWNNKINLRQSAAELTADYKSLQKVYKLRFDDNRSHLSVKSISNSFNKQLDLNSGQTKFDTILTKNSNKVFSVKFFNTEKLNSNFESQYLFNLTNNYTFDLPFLMSLQSDQSRYIWFDWFARWSKYEVQQASLAKLGLYGLPKFDKTIEYGSNGQTFVDSENYLSRLMIKRKNYFVTSRFSPVFFETNKNLNSLSNYLNNNSISSKTTLLFLKNNKINFQQDAFKLNKNLRFKNFESGVNKYGKNFIKTNSLSNYISLYNDLETKKTFSLKNVLSRNNILPLTPTNFNSVNSNKNLLSLNYDNNFSFFNQTYSVKNQYTPIKRGVSNMIKIQASNMIALPVELRIQVLASSRDIIHSWAIPSAGIKIDCVPGYSSHRVLFFMLSGIYWGQCMEICGRYHHWMPIIIYFMKRDLFFLWCSHFVLTNKTNFINNYSDSNKFFKNTPINFKKSYN